MSANLVSHHEVIPMFESHIFDDRPDAHLAVGVVAVGSQIVPGREAEFHNDGVLRGNTYYGQKGYTDVTVLPDGTEFDADDNRAIHLGVYENTALATRGVGSMRIVIKTDTDPSPLPVERHYPEAFPGGPTPVRSVEISRWIGRHEDPIVQNKLRWPLFTAAVKLLLENDLGPTFGVVEPRLAKRLGRIGVPVTILSDSKEMPGVKDAKQAIQIDVKGLAQNIVADTPDAFAKVATIEQGYAYYGTVPLLSSAASATRLAVA
jgi:N-acyl-L-homoserine lactone synthetase